MKQMKKCPYCGAIQQPSRQSCIDCGRVLPSADEANSAELEAQAELAYARRFAWDFRSPLFRIAFVGVVISVISLIISVVLIAFLGNTHNVSWCAVSAIFAGIALFWGLAPCFDAVLDYLLAPRNSDRKRFGGLKFVVFMVLISTLISVGLLIWFLIDMPFVGEPGLMFEFVPYRRGRLGICIS